MNPLDHGRDERRVLIRDRERPVDEPATDSQPRDHGLILRPAEPEPVSGSADDVANGPVHREDALPVAPLHDEHGNARREPRAGDPVYVYGDRRTVLAVTATVVMTDDDAGLRLQLPRSRMWWDGDAFRVAA